MSSSAASASKLGGNFYEPTMLTGVTPQMKVAREETFGPVAPLFRFKTEEEAMRMANDTPFGLAAYFYTRDLGRCWRVAEALEYGIVGINEGIISTEVAPVRRRQGERPRPRGLAPRHRGIPRNQIPADGRPLAGRATSHLRPPRLARTAAELDASGGESHEQ